MKKLLSILTAYIFTINAVWGVVPVTTVWELRSADTAGNVNGCGFDPASAKSYSVDYSQQYGAQITATDWAIGNPQTNQLTSASSSFSHTMEGNMIHCTAGAGFTTTGNGSWHIITDVLGDGTVVLFDNAGTAGSTGGTCRLGGGCSLNSTLDADLFVSVNSSNTIWIRNDGQYTIGETMNLGSTHTAILPGLLRGYNKVRGDAPHFSTAPIINAGGNTFTLGQYWVIRNLDINAQNAAGLSVGLGGEIENVRIINNRSAAAGVAVTVVGGQSRVIKSDIASTNGTAINSGANNNTFIFNIIHESSICYSMAGSDFATLYGNVFELCDSTAVSLGGGSAANKIIFNTFFGTNTVVPNKGTGIWMSLGTSVDNFITNNHFVGFSTAMKIVDVANSNYTDYNNFWNNTVNVTTAAPNGPHDTFVDPQFVDWIHTDLTPQNLATKIAVGFGNTNTTTYIYTGAVQPNASSGGGTRGSIFLK